MTRPVVNSGRAGTEPFPTAALDAAANVNATGLPYTAKLWLLQETLDAGGGVRRSYAPGDEVACRIEPARQQMSEGDRMSEDTTHIVTFARTVGVTTNDQLEIAGTRYAVTAKPDFGTLESGRRVEVKTV